MLTTNKRRLKLSRAGYSASTGWLDVTSCQVTRCWLCVRNTGVGHSPLDVPPDIFSPDMPPL